jgi:hypothetical protein
MPFQYIRTESGEFKCPHCDYAKVNQSTVHMHIKAKHSGTFKHKCTSCDYETTSKQNLDNHIACKHPSKTEPIVKDICCPQENCKYTCRTKAHLRSHYLVKHLTKEVNELMVKDEESTEYCCSVCESAFPSRNAFLYHCVGCLPDSVAENDTHLMGLAL